jgi:prepilin peptidase CpaA
MLEHVILPAACVGLLLYAAAHDILARTIPDGVSVALAACGLVISASNGTLVGASIAAAVVFAASILLFRLGLMGGGDVKLLGAVALVVPPGDILTALAAIAIAGGALAVVFLILRPLARRRTRPLGHRRLGLLHRGMAAELWRIRRGGPLPYAVAIASGTVFTMISTG